MAITIQRDGQRVYLIGDTYAAKDKIKSIGGHWDGDRRAWWVGAKKAAEAQALVESLTNPPATAAQAAAAGLDPTTPAAIVADKLDDDGKPTEAAAVRSQPKPKEDPDNIRLTGKGRYKGREYFAGAITKDGQRVRLLTLPDADGNYLDFWANCSEVEQTKEYKPREVWDGGRYSNRTVTQYTTLGSIADFVAKQKRAKAAGLPECVECGKRGELVHDLEDGGMKCRACCDMPE